MDRQQLIAYADDAMNGLKDFQSASVEALYHRLYEEERPCMLLADEVGLGKTVVARGLIAKVLKRRAEEGKRKPFKVTYICSNQVIAHENLRKLNLFPKGVAMKRPISRIAYLAHMPEEETKKDSQPFLELNTLTPGTSFQISQGAGNKWERRIIYHVLHRDLKMRNRRNGLRWMFKGTCNMDKYRKELDRYCDWPLQEGLAERFIADIKSKKLPEDAQAVIDELPGSSQYSLYDATLAFATMLDGRNWRRLWNGSHLLTRMLRECLVECCLPYVDADLYILDEFQRFRDLIDQDGEGDQARIARKVFFQQKKDTRILLLSATPFKAFTGYDDVERGEDHYKDFGRVLRFLLRDDKERLQHYDKHRKILYKQIMDLRGGDVDDVSDHHRVQVEQILRSVMCRTERHSVAADSNAMIEDVWKDDAQALPFGPGDIDNFRSTDRLVRALNRLKHPLGKPVNYCKSALHPLSFLDRYKLKELLKKHRDHPKIQRELELSQDGWLDLPQIDTYDWSIEGKESGKTGVSNARLKMLLDTAVGPHGAELLWVPPSLPYYSLEGGFKGSEGFTKTLLFSSWIMVPRMIATMISYEVEKRTVGNPVTVREEQEKEPRTYFTSEGKHRRPVPQIRYAKRRYDDEVQLANMSNFTLLYPSQTLRDAVDPVDNLKHGRSLSEILEKTSGILREKIAKAGLDQYVTQTKDGDRWYWAAPLLLDMADETAGENLKRWIEDGAHWGRDSWFSRKDGKDGEDSGVKEEHFTYLVQCIDDPSKAGLGPIPDDLPEFLAKLALGSPAVTALRSLTRIFPEEPAPVCMVRAFDIADEFCSLFNKPESIAAVRLSTPVDWYWKRVVAYCASGCLQAMLDEYFHLLTGQNQNISVIDASTQLQEAININASTVNVDSLDTFMKDDARKMRCHYAVPFGNQRIETSEGRKRATGLREVFNSPFRPFVLATTSIGQEGLDFHSYCRRIVHWNLPGNPVDLEQREGRINRYKSLVIRQQLARKYAATLAEQDPGKHEDIWETLFEIADREEREKAGKCELVPYWHIDAEDGVKIERVIPLYPFSIDHRRLKHILKTLAIYRLAFGQPRQAELVEQLLDRDFSKDEMKQVMESLMIDLSPISYGSK